MRWLYTVLLFLLTTPGFAQPTKLPSLANSDAYEVVFADDFRYPNRDSLLSPHLLKWAPQHTWGTAHWDTTTRCNNIHPNNYAYRPEDIRLVPNPAVADDQLLALDFNYHAEPLRRILASDGTVTEGEFYKTSGLVRALFRGDSTCPETGFKYGVFEIRCKVPVAEGLQAAFWLWAGKGLCETLPSTWDDGVDTWEIDVFEAIGIAGRRDFFGTLQPNAYRRHKPSVTYYHFAPGNGPEADFHTYTLVWTPNLLAWYVDGALYKSLRNPRRSARARRNPAGIPRTELNLLLSSHYQWDCKSNDHCATLPDGATPNDQQCPPPNDPFLIDYVRVYRPRQLPANGKWPLLETRRQHWLAGRNPG